MTATGNNKAETGSGPARVIEILGLFKTFRIYHDPKDRLKEIFLRRTLSREFTALKDVTFHLVKGETVGIIGQNGAGKSTLLKILTGILLPTAGTVRMEGRVTGLLELGTGFNMELSGRNNIYMNGMLLGMSRDTIDSRLDSIMQFAELGDFMEEPIKTYSSGMLMRLAFSVAIHADPSVFVIDEALSVGDAYFQQKCMRRIKDFKRSGGSIIFVSHDMNAVKMLCDRAILLHRGGIFEEGHPEDVVNAYNVLVAKMADSEGKVVVDRGSSESHGTFEARITNVSITGKDSGSATVSSGEEVTVTVNIEAMKDYDNVTTGILIRDRFGQDIFGTNLFLNHIRMNIISGRRYRVNYTMKMNIGPGKYSVTVAIHGDPDSGNKRLHWIDKVVSFEVVGIHGKTFIGVCRLTPEIGIEEPGEALPGQAGASPGMARGVEATGE